MSHGAVCSSSGGQLALLVKAQAHFLNLPRGRRKRHVIKGVDSDAWKERSKTPESQGQRERNQVQEVRATLSGIHLQALTHKF